MSVCPYVPRTVTVRGHTDISEYEQLPRDIGDIRASLCTNSLLYDSLPKKQESVDSDGNRILQNQKQKLLQDSGAPDYHFY